MHKGSNVSDRELLNGILELLEYSNSQIELSYRILKIVRNPSYTTMIDIINDARESSGGAFQHATIPF